MGAVRKASEKGPRRGRRRKRGARRERRGNGGGRESRGGRRRGRQRRDGGGGDLGGGTAHTARVLQPHGRAAGRRGVRGGRGAVWRGDF